MTGYCCEPCDATVEAVWPGEADLLARLHDDLIHNGRYTAKVAVDVVTRPLIAFLTVVLALLFTVTGAATIRGPLRTSVVLAVPAVRRRSH